MLATYTPPPLPESVFNTVRVKALFGVDGQVGEDYIEFSTAVDSRNRIGGQELTIQQIVNFYIINGVLPINGGSFGANLGATFWSKDTLEGVKTDDEGFRSLRKTVKHFTKFLEQHSYH